jgi:hypothetical protein
MKTDSGWMACAEAADSSATATTTTDGADFATKHDAAAARFFTAAQCKGEKIECNNLLHFGVVDRS